MLQALSTLVLFGHLCQFWSYSVHFILIRSTSVLFSPYWSNSVHCPLRSSVVLFWSSLVLFAPIWFILFSSLQFGPIQSNLVLFFPIWSYSVLFSLFFLLWFNSVHVGPITYNLVLFSRIWSYSVQFGHMRSTLLLFSPI